MNLHDLDEVKTPRNWINNAKSIANQQIIHKPAHTVRVALIAVCICLALFGAAAAAEALWGTPITIHFSEDRPGHYTTIAPVSAIPEEMYSSGIKNALAYNQENDTPALVETFSSWADCETHLGIDLLTHPWLEQDYDWDTSSHILDPNYGPRYQTIIHGSSGSLGIAETYASMNIDGTELKLEAWIFGEESSNNFPTSNGIGRTVTEETYQMANGLNALIITLDDPDGYCMIEAYFATEYVRYRFFCLSNDVNFVHDFLDQLTLP